MANFPSSIPSYTGFTSSHTLSQDSHASQHNSEQGDITAIATKVGTGSSTPTNNTVLCGNGTGTSTWRALTSSDVGLGNVSNVSESQILQAVYPIGCIYTETTGVNPATTFGFGTWAAYGQGRVLVGAGTSDQAFTAGNRGGESNHTITTSEMPAHNHGVTDPGHNHNPTNGGMFNVGSGAGATVPQIASGGGTTTTTTSTTGVTTNNTGSGGSHNNLQPYIVVYMWIRNS